MSISARPLVPSIRYVRSLPGLGWLLAAAVLFIAAEFAVTPLRLPLGWDEITYIAQTSAHASPVVMPPVHSRGAGLLAAPVTLLTTSVEVLRAWMTLLSGAGLFLALLAWRRLRPGPVLALTVVIIGGLAVTQLSAVEVMPDWWEAIGALAVTGLFLQAVTTGLTRLVAVLLAAGVFFLVLVRWQDAVFLTAPLVVGLLVVPAWRCRGTLAALAAGLAAGAAEWAGEAWLFYGGPASRVRLAAREPPTFGLYFSLFHLVRNLTAAPRDSPRWVHPWLGVWWTALLVLAILGIIIAWRTRPAAPDTPAAPAAVLAARATVAVPAACAVTLLAAYSVFDDYAIPRYLLPVIVLAAIPAADAIAWLVAPRRWQAAALPLVAVFLLAGLITQHYVLRGQAASTGRLDARWVAQADYLHHVGVRPPCITGPGHLPVAYYLGCTPAWADQHLSTLLAQRPGPGAWHLLHDSRRPIKVYIRT